MTIDVRAKRVYDAAEPGDGHRVLIDHVWPRGISRERADLDEWARELAPSDELRKWFDHVPERFDEFRSRYRGELATHGEQIAELRPSLLQSLGRQASFGGQLRCRDALEDPYLDPSRRSTSSPALT